MTDPQVISIIQAALASAAPKRTADFVSVTLATSIESLNLDSIATMEMIGQIEETTKRTFPDEDLARVMTLGDLAGLIRR